MITSALSFEKFWIRSRRNILCRTTFKRSSGFKVTQMHNMAYAGGVDIVSFAFGRHGQYDIERPVSIPSPDIPKVKPLKT